MTRRHPRVRTWTLAALDLETEYRLWFDPAAYRWEVRPLGEQSGTVSTRDVPGPRAGARSDPSGDREASGRSASTAASGGRHRRLTPEQ